MSYRRANGNKLYQIGGDQGNTTAWFRYNQKDTCRAVWGALFDETKREPGIELMLGINASGAAHVLLTDEQMQRVQQRSGQRASGYKDPSSFASLSPIFFETSDALTRKITSDKQKAAKNGIYSKAPPQDAFCPRAEFEYSRLLWRCLTKPLPLNHWLPHLNDQQLLQAATFVSFVTNKWHPPGGQSSKECKILDIGWSTITASSVIHAPAHSLEPTHIAVSESALLRNDRELKKDSKTELVRNAVMLSRLREFQTTWTSHTILLVSDYKLIIQVFKNAGVDTSLWKLGLKSLFLPSMTRVNRSRSSRSRSPMRENAPYRRRPRSPSPQSITLSYDDPSPASSSKKSAIKQDVIRPSEVFVINVHDLFITLKHKVAQSETSHEVQVDSTIGDMAKYLGLPSCSSVICAGEESQTVLQAWCSMASGITIDDQREQRSQQLSEVIESETKIPPAASEAPGMSDDEDDPNNDPNNAVAPSDSKSSIDDIYDQYDDSE